MIVVIVVLLYDNVVKDILVQMFYFLYDRSFWTLIHFLIYVSIFSAINVRSARIVFTIFVCIGLLLGFNSILFHYSSHNFRYYIYSIPIPRNVNEDWWSSDICLPSYELFIRSILKILRKFDLSSLKQMFMIW